MYDGNNYKKNLGRNANTLVNSSRFNISGQHRFYKDFSLLAFSEWNMPNGRGSKESLSSRDQYLGISSKKYGKLIVGKFTDFNTTVLGMTGVNDDFGSIHRGDTSGDRRSGQIKYLYDNNGYTFGLGYQTSADSVPVVGVKDNVKSGYSVLLGYTFDDVHGKPLAIKTSYSLLNSKDFDDEKWGEKDYLPFSKLKQICAGISWGRKTEGLYLAAGVDRYILRYTYPDDIYSSEFIDDIEDYNNDIDVDPSFYSKFGARMDVRGLDLAAVYTFENGIQTVASFNISNYKYYFDGVINDIDFYIRHLIFNVNYSYKNLYLFAEFDIPLKVTGFRDPDEKEDLCNLFELNTKTTAAFGAKYIFQIIIKQKKTGISQFFCFCNVDFTTFSYHQRFHQDLSYQHFHLLYHLQQGLFG